MKCEHCHGIPTFPPCLSCNGWGIGHCCEGMVGGPYEPASQNASAWGTIRHIYQDDKQDELANWNESTNRNERASPQESTNTDEPL